MRVRVEKTLSERIPAGVASSIVSIRVCDAEIRQSPYLALYIRRDSLILRDHVSM